MGQSNCGRTAAASAVVLLGLASAFGHGPARAANTPGNVGGGLASRPCPTRFDYVVLASFADAPSLLSLSTYHFRSEVGFRTVPLTGLLGVDYPVESSGSGGRTCGDQGEVRRAVLVPDDVRAARDHDGRSGEQARSG
jgi:hypothetical protein